MLIHEKFMKIKERPYMQMNSHLFYRRPSKASTETALSSNQVEFATRVEAEGDKHLPTDILPVPGISSMNDCAISFIDQKVNCRSLMQIAIPLVGLSSVSQVGGRIIIT